jgi:Putative transposase
LQETHRAGKLQFYGDNIALADAKEFARWLAPLRQCEWVVYAKRPFAGPEAVLAYLSRYTHRVAIANSRLVAMDERGVTFRWKDYRDKSNPERPRHKTMTLTADEFMRRFLLHVLPTGLHRIRHFGLIANNGRREKLALARELLGATCAPADSAVQQGTAEPMQPTYVCRHCGAPMLIIETIVRAKAIRAPPALRGTG